MIKGRIFYTGSKHILHKHATEPRSNFINLNKYCFTRLYWAVRTCGCTEVIACTFLFFLFFLLFPPLISRRHPSAVLHHDVQSQPSWDLTIRRPRTEQHRDKVNIKQDAEPELQVFLNQPGLICHFNLYRGKMDPSTHTSYTWTELLVPLC